MRMLNHDMKVVNISNEIKSHTKREFRNSNFYIFFFNWVISIIYGAKFTKFGTHVVEGHLDGTMCQIFYLGLSFNVMKSRKLNGKKR